MGTGAGNSVVNSYGQTHEIANLYVAGPGIFATGGASNPTYTIFALSLRGALAPDVLADWLRRRETDATTEAADRRGAILLDGSDSRSEWSSESSPRGPGLVPYARSPRLERRDYVFNANDSAWVPHATARLSGYSAAFGPERTPRSLRTRMNEIGRAHV